MATVFAPFNPGRLTDKVLQDHALVREKFEAAVQAVKLRDGEIRKLGASVEDLQRRADACDKALKERDSEVEALRKELANQASRVQELNEKIRMLQESLPKIAVQTLVSEFKANVDRINADVRSQKTPGMLVDQVEVEVRGGIDVSDGLRITQLPVSALNADSASLLKFSLKPSSPLKIVDDESGQR